MPTNGVQLWQGDGDLRQRGGRGNQLRYGGKRRGFGVAEVQPAAADLLMKAGVGGIHPIVDPQSRPPLYGQGRQPDKSL